MNFHSETIGEVYHLHQCARDRGNVKMSVVEAVHGNFNLVNDDACICSEAKVLSEAERREQELEHNRVAQAEAAQRKERQKQAKEKKKLQKAQKAEQQIKVGHNQSDN